MVQPNSNDGLTPDSLTRRKILSLGAGATGAVIGLGAVPGSAAAWQRFEVDFRGCDEVRMLVDEADLRFDPPAVARVIVAVDGETDCRTVEVTPEAATTMPDDYGSTPVVPYTAAAGETILGTMEYNYREDRFGEPVCLMVNESACAAGDAVPDVRTADCVQAGKAGYWNGSIRECAADPLDDAGPLNTDVETGPEPRLREAISPADAETGDGFGTAVQLSGDGGDVLLVGAPAATAGDEAAGAAYVFEDGDGSWTQTARLAPGDASDGGQFGYDVDLDAAGKTAIVGAPDAERDGGTGVATVFEHDGTSWSTVGTLSPSADLDTPSEDVRRFGHAVALSDDGTRAVVGAPYASGDGTHDGAAVAYERTDGGWVPHCELGRDTAGDSQQFGRAVCLSGAGDRFCAGAPVPFPDTVNPAGWVGVYPDDLGGVPEDTLTSSAGESGDNLGAALGCNGPCDLLIAGDPRYNEGETNRPGTATVFTRSGSSWAEAVTIAPGDGSPVDGFGSAIDLDVGGVRAMVGAPGTVHAGDDYQETVYAFERNGDDWTEAHAFRADPAETNNSFGEAVSFDDPTGTVAVGAPAASAGDADPGAVYVFRIA